MTEEQKREKRHEYYLAHVKEYAARHKANYLANREHYISQSKIWREKHPLAQKIYQKRWQSKNAGRNSEKYKEKASERIFFLALSVVSGISSCNENEIASRQEEISEERKTRDKIEHQKYRTLHREEIKIYEREWRARHKDDVEYQARKREKRRQYEMQHRNEINAKRRERRKRYKNRNNILEEK